MKVSAHPLVVAAALGLLGPAALAEDDADDTDSMAGVWTRLGGATADTPLPLGDQIEVIPFEDRVLLDDGIGIHADRSTWTQVQPGMALQELVVGDSLVRREFVAQGGRLEVITTVLDGASSARFTEVFVRAT